MAAASYAAILLSRKRVVYRERVVDCNAGAGACNVYRMRSAQG